MEENKLSTRHFSKQQEDYVAELINGVRQPNSGASAFHKMDVVNKEASIGIECKTPTKEKESFTIKKEWIEKNRQEAYSKRIFNQAIAFTFAPKQENFFVIDEKLFKFLVEKLEEEYK